MQLSETVFRRLKGSYLERGRRVQLNEGTGLCASVETVSRRPSRGCMVQAAAAVAAGPALGPVFVPIVLAMEPIDHRDLLEHWCTHHQVCMDGRSGARFIGYIQYIEGIIGYRVYV